MAYISLYRKYRPRKFSEVVGQDIIIKILKNSIINNKINHAYIFSGPRGTGKTSIAKIFAKAVNCLNNFGDICDECEVCKTDVDDEIDIVEIDAASNNGIDEIREIRNTIKLLPSILKYKVYIIDEVHMLSTSAFNALLKTLEEPPSHAIFILATTEINKIPATVLSRCQKFDFKKIDNKHIVNRLKYICECENIKIDNDIINFIAELSDGGLRDAINLLDQINSLDKEKITRTDVLNLIGSIDQNEVFDLFNSVLSGSVSDVIEKVDAFYHNNKNFVQVVSELEVIIKDILIFNNTKNYFDEKYEEKLYTYSKIDVNLLIKVSEELFELYNNLKRSNNQMIIAEIIFIKITLLFSDNNSKINSDTTIDSEKTNKDIKKVSDDEKKEINIKNEDDIDSDNKKIIINNALCTANKTIKNEFIKKYEVINEYLTNKEYNSVANLLIKATPEVVSDEYILFIFENQFEIVLFDRNIELIIKFLKHIYKKTYNVAAIDKEEWLKIKDEYIKNIKSGYKYELIDLKKKKRTKKKTTELENSVEDIFGEEYIVEE